MTIILSYSWGFASILVNQNSPIQPVFGVITPTPQAESAEKLAHCLAMVVAEPVIGVYQ
ncbi:hypothetical protein SAMN05428947_11092 [Mucilaginibacter sp. OK283]|nr:hypothetical protein SAMN05428947_11092 [Mucilaginibacter sp. OK283]